MKQKLFSLVLSLCLCISVVPAAQAEGDVPTPQEVYEILIALKNEDGYLEGTPWDDSNHSYDWNGGPVAGNITGGTGCAAFAFELSDKAFGNQPARTFTTGNFTFSDVRAGDILRILGNSHSVIVLQVTDGGVIVAEANYHVNGGAGIVHWGSALSKEEVEAADYFITRYPEGYISPDDPTAGEEIDSGDFGSLAWKLTKEGTLTISGSGAMPDFAGPADVPWDAYMDEILTIVIEDGVTNVGSSAFYGCKALSATIPSSVTAIGGNAFYGSALVSVNIPSSVRTIGDNAFRSCANLVSASISEGVETIGSGAFRSCTKLASIALPASVRSVGESAFLECTEMTQAAFKPSAANDPVIMGGYMFAECWKLSNVTLPQKVDCIAEYMFYNCKFLSSLTIPQGAASIGESAFAKSSLVSVYIPASVGEIGISAFPLPAALTDVYFGGDEAAWNSIQKVPTVATALADATIHYNAETPGTPETPEPPGTPETPSVPSVHTHSWASAWSSDNTYHWHECTAENCSVTNNSEKSGYGAHSYGDWVVDESATSSQSGSRHRTCAVCGYSQTDSIPATGSDRDHSSSDSTPSSKAATTVTTRNPDGSTTTTTTDSRTGTVTETTRNLDGSSTVTVEQKNGITAAVTIHAAGEVEAEVSLPASVASAAQQSGEAVALPIPEVQAARNMKSAPTVTVNTGSGVPVKVEIPVVAPTPGTVAVAVHSDGTETVVKDSVPTADGVVASLPDGVTVKIVDNSKDFTDISPQYWASDAIDFVSARELFAGTTTTTFTPEAPMTRAMLMVVLARFDGADADEGTTWYEKGMEWAVANGISDGSSPGQSITREQLVTMLWRYAGSPNASGTLAGFADAGQISSYAQGALLWAVENGVVSGFSDGQIKPQGQATRAQVAQMLKNFIENQF